MSRLLILAVVIGCGRGESPIAPTPTSPIVTSPDAMPGDGPAAPVGCTVATPSLGPGLTVERWPIAATPAAGGPPCIDVVRADLARHRLRAFTADGTDRNAPAWREHYKLVAVTNAGMFHEGGEPVGLVVANGTARGHDNAKMSGFLAWDPVSTKDAPAIVTGKTCPGFDLADLRKRYRSMVQSYRFLGCDGKALPWQDAKQYSAAAIGIDRTGRVVFLHARAAVTMTELATALASHDLAGALFLEGGPEASLVVRGSQASLERVGSYETNFVENDSNTEFWTLPNVIALEPR